MKKFTFITSIICCVLSIVCVVLLLVFSMHGAETLTLVTMGINSVTFLIDGVVFFQIYLNERSLR